MWRLVLLLCIPFCVFRRLCWPLGSLFSIPYVSIMCNSRCSDFQTHKMFVQTSSCTTRGICEQRCKIMPPKPLHLLPATDVCMYLPIHLPIHTAAHLQLSINADPTFPYHLPPPYSPHFVPLLHIRLHFQFPHRPCCKSYDLMQNFSLFESPSSIVAFTPHIRSSLNSIQ